MNAEKKNKVIDALFKQLYRKKANLIRLALWKHRLDEFTTACLFQDSATKYLDKLRSGELGLPAEDLEPKEATKKFIGTFFKIYHGIIIDHIRRNKNHAWIFEEITADDTKSSLKNVLEKLSREDAKKFCEALLQMLSPVDREIVELRDEYDKSYKEIAAKTGIENDDTVNQKHRRAIKYLHDVLVSKGFTFEALLERFFLNP